MSVAEWIERRAAEPPVPPPRLVARILSLAKGERSLAAGGAPSAAAADVRVGVPGGVPGEWPADAPAERLVRAAGVVLARLLQDGETARDSALELLSADALATYAFESQCDDPDALDARCEWAMRHLSRIADPA